MYVLKGLPLRREGIRMILIIAVVEGMFDKRHCIEAKLSMQHHLNRLIASYN